MGHLLILGLHREDTGVVCIQFGYSWSLWSMKLLLALLLDLLSIFFLFVFRPPEKCQRRLDNTPAIISLLDPTV